MNDKSRKSSTLFTPSGCLTGDALLLFVSDTLKGQELEKAQQHISECPLCADAAEGLKMWLQENSLQNQPIPESTENPDEETPFVTGKESFKLKPWAHSNSLESNLFYKRTALLNQHIRQRLQTRTLSESGKAKRLAYKPFVWLAAAASIILFIGVGYVLWLQNHNDIRFQAQQLQKDKDAALIAQMPEDLAYPPSNSKVILDVKYHSEKGTHIPPVVTIVNEEVALASDRVKPVGKNAVQTNDEAEFTESRHGVESDVFREEYGMYKGQNTKRALSAKNSGGAMQKTETDEETSTVFISVQQMPSFPGGDAARIKYLAKNIRYPARAAEDGIQGTIHVSFVVKTDGRITNVKLLHGIGGGCDEEAIRVVAKMPQWKPGYVNGKKVDVLYNMPVQFKLK
jgi:TonB family protein